MRFKQTCNDTDIEIEGWNPPVPSYFSTGVLSKQTVEELISYSQSSQRIYKFTHPLRDANAFTPKNCVIEERQMIYWVSPTYLIIQNECFASKAPFTDTFKVKNLYEVKEIEGNRTTFEWKMNIEFLKNTMFKGKIARSGSEEAQDVADNKLAPLIPQLMKDTKLETQRAMVTVEKVISVKKQRKPSHTTNHNEEPISNHSSEQPVSNIESSNIDPGQSASRPEEKKDISSDSKNASSQMKSKESLVGDGVRGQGSSEAAFEEEKDKQWDTAPMEKQDMFASRKELHSRQITPFDKYPELVLSERLEDCTAADVYRALFGDYPMKTRGKTYPNAMVRHEV